MEKKFLTFIILIAFFSCNNHKKQTINQDKVKKVKSLIEQVRKQLSPDKRNLIFDIKVVQENNKIILKGVTDLDILKKRLFVFLKRKGYEVVDSLRLLPEKKFKKLLGITRLSVANLRAEPKHSSELVTQTLMGMPLLIYEEHNGFYHVKTPEAYYAWVDAAGIIIMDSTQVRNWFKLPKIIMTKHCGKVYDAPEQNAQPVSDFVLNDVFGLVEKQSDYTQVVYPDGRYGYVKNDSYITLDDFKERYRKTTNNDMINYARQYIGIPYLWGGTSTKGLDCSGFTKTLYAQFGYNLPRDASQQVKIGKEITITPDFSNLLPGDLLFFGSKKNGVEKVTHVALHIGNGRIIHATGEVKIESLNKKDADFNPDRYKTLLHARRINGYIGQVFVNYYTKDCPMLEFIYDLSY